MLCWASLCRMSLCWVSWHPFYCYAEYHYAVFLCATKPLVLFASASEKKRKKGFVMLKPGRSRSRGPRPTLTVQQTWGSRRPGDNVITHLSLSLTLVWNKLECLTLVSFFRLAYLRLRQKPNLVDHLKGRLLALSANTRLDWKNISRTNTFVYLAIVSDEAKRFYGIDTCMNMPFNATTMMAESTAWKNQNESIRIKIKQDWTKYESSVMYPFECCL